MAFPLAHPAAVLALRRYCPRHLSLPALVLGSVAPDAAYLLGPLSADGFSHTVLGSLGFGLPAGLVMVGLFYSLRSPLVQRFPRRYRDLFRPLCDRPTPSFFVLVFSVLLGVWSHLLWDSFTHKDGWFVQHLAFLHLPCFQLDQRQGRVCHVVWYVSSFLGIGWLYWAYQQWRRTPAGGSRPTSRTLMLRNAALVALLFFPIQALHHLFNHPLESYSVGALTVALVLCTVWRLDRNVP